MDTRDHHRRFDGDTSRSLAASFHAAVDFVEPAVEWLIRLCGWSSIVFVIGIFLFVFLQAAPVLFGS